MTKRLRGTVGATISRPQDEIFDYLRDVHRHAEWSPRPYRVEGIDGQVELGSTFVSYGWIPGDRDHRNDVTVTKLDAPTSIEFTSEEQGEQFINTYTLTPVADGTRVDKHMDMPRPGGLGGMFFPLLFAGFIKPANQRGMGMLKDRLESSP